MRKTGIFNFAVTSLTVLAFTACNTTSNSGSELDASGDRGAGKLSLHITAVVDASGATDIALTKDDGGRRDTLEIFESCAQANGAPDMFAEITWEVCRSSTYEIEIDNPYSAQTGYKVVATDLSGGKSATHAFKCGAAPSTGGKTALKCDEIVAPVHHFGPHTSVGVTNE